MKEQNPAIRIRLAERSLRVFVMGLLGLIPLFGIPLASLSIALGWKVRRAGRGQWHPGRRYATVGMALGVLSLLAHIGIVVAMV